jgi:hypothetical protein
MDRLRREVDDLGANQLGTEHYNGFDDRLTEG